MCSVQLASATDPVSDMHWLPCTVSHTGPAPVANYFMPHATGNIIDGVELREAAFRGRQLRGDSLAVPAGYTGTVLARRDQAGQPEAAWQAEARFESVTYWNHDTHPAKMDSAQRCFEWLGLARAMAEPVSPEEVAKQLAASQ